MLHTGSTPEMARTPARIGRKRDALGAPMEKTPFKVRELINALKNSIARGESPSMSMLLSMKYRHVQKLVLSRAAIATC